MSLKSRSNVCLGHHCGILFILEVVGRLSANRKKTTGGPGEAQPFARGREEKLRSRQKEVKGTSSREFSPGIQGTKKI